MKDDMIVMPSVGAGLVQFRHRVPALRQFSENVFYSPRNPSILIFEINR